MTWQALEFQRSLDWPSMATAVRMPIRETGYNEHPEKETMVRAASGSGGFPGVWQVIEETNGLGLQLSPAVSLIRGKVLLVAARKALFHTRRNQDPSGVITRLLMPSINFGDPLPGALHDRCMVCNVAWIR